MRLSLTATVVGLLAFGSMMASPDPVAATKSKMGCDSDTEIWDAALGKCTPGTPKYKRKSADQASPPPKVGSQEGACRQKGACRQEGPGCRQVADRLSETATAHSQRALPVLSTRTLSCGTSRKGISAPGSCRMRPRSTRLTPPCEATTASCRISSSHRRRDPTACDSFHRRSAANSSNRPCARRSPPDRRLGDRAGVRPPSGRSGFRLAVHPCDNLRWEATTRGA